MAVAPVLAPELVFHLRISQVGHQLAGHAAGGRANGRAHGHADGSCHAADGSTCGHRTGHATHGSAHRVDAQRAMTLATLIQAAVAVQTGAVAVGKRTVALGQRPIAFAEGAVPDVATADSAVVKRGVHGTDEGFVIGHDGLLLASG